MTLVNILGGKLRKVELNNCIGCWAFSSTQYVQDAVNNVEQYLKVKRKNIIAKAPAPFQNNYCPEIDMTEYLGGMMHPTNILLLE